MTVTITKPTVGGSEGAWGTLINTALDDIVDVLNGTTAMTPDLTSFDIGGVPVTATAAEINILSGATVTAAELNVLDGVTATVTEINYVDGVTSNIQTQLDGKQASDATLTALAGLATGENKVPYSTGTDTFGQLDFKDEDDMASDSATAVPSQQSVKAYVDNSLTEFLIVKNEQTSGTDGASLTASDWTTQNINTVHYNGITGASLSTKQITLPAGTYRVSGWGGAATKFNTVDKSNSFQPRLRNVTDGTTTVVGANGRSSGYSGTLSDSHHLPVNGVFTIASEKVFELQVYADAGGEAIEGHAMGAGEVETYAELIFQKIG